MWVNTNVNVLQVSSCNFSPPRIYFLFTTELGRDHSRSQQRTNQRVLVLTLKFLVLKRLVFPRKKYFPFFFTFLYLLFYATFKCGPYNILKNKQNNFLPKKTFKSGPQKLLIIDPNLFLQSSPAHSPKLIFFSNYKYVPRLICLLICGVKRAW